MNQEESCPHFSVIQFHVSPKNVVIGVNTLLLIHPETLFQVSLIQLTAFSAPLTMSSHFFFKVPSSNIFPTHFPKPSPKMLPKIPPIAVPIPGAIIVPIAAPPIPPAMPPPNPPTFSPTFSFVVPINSVALSKGPSMGTFFNNLPAPLPKFLNVSPKPFSLSVSLNIPARPAIAIIPGIFLVKLPNLVGDFLFFSTLVVPVGLFGLFFGPFLLSVWVVPVGFKPFAQQEQQLILNKPFPFCVWSEFWLPN